MISIFYPLCLHFDSLNCFCFCCETAVRTKLKKLSCIMCVAFCSISPIWKLSIIPDKSTKSFFAWKINHSSSNIYGSLLYERRHSRNWSYKNKDIYIFFFFLIALWHKNISWLRMILDDFKNKRRRVVDDISLTFDINI